jgi:hypothetical protein
MKRTWITAAAVTIGSLVTVWAPAAHAQPNWGPQDLEQNPQPTAPKISVSDGSVAEGNVGTHVLHFSVTLSTASDEQVKATLKTIGVVGNAATPDVDYGPRVALVAFAPGQTVKSFDVEVYGDKDFETNEKVGATIANVTKATMGKQNGMGTIVNDDDPPIAQPPADPKGEDPKPGDPTGEEPEADTPNDSGSDNHDNHPQVGGTSSQGGGSTSTTVAPTGEQALGTDGAVPAGVEQGDDLMAWLVIITAALAGAVVLILLLPPRRRRNA